MARFKVRFWLEAASALFTLLLAVVTIVWQNWIEIVFRVDPDHGAGSLERWVVGAAAVLCLTSLLLARREWKGAGPRLAGASSSG